VGDNVKGVEGPTHRTSTATESLSEGKEIGAACFFRKIQSLIDVMALRWI
jgi:hypothetical protein